MKDTCLFKVCWEKKRKKNWHFNIFGYTYLPKTDICQFFSFFFFYEAFPLLGHHKCFPHRQYRISAKVTKSKSNFRLTWRIPETSYPLRRKFLSIVIKKYFIIHALAEGHKSKVNQKFRPMGRLKLLCWYKDGSYETNFCVVFHLLLQCLCSVATSGAGK